MFERSNDPVRDAERYMSDLEDSPKRRYMATMTFTVHIPVYAHDESEAIDQAMFIEEGLADAIFCLDHPDDIEDIDEVEQGSVRVKEEEE